jgi:hypothetical protein
MTAACRRLNPIERTGYRGYHLDSQEYGADTVSVILVEPVKLRASVDEIAGARRESNRDVLRIAPGNA